MKSASTLIAVVGLMWSAVLAQSFKGIVPNQGLVFPQIVVGGDSETEMNLLAQGADDSEGDVQIYDQIGQPLPVLVNGSGPMSEFTYSLASGSPANYVLTSNSETLKVGFVVVSQQKPEDQTANGAGQNRTRDKSGAISGKVTFRLRSGEDLLAQVAALPAQELSKVHLTFDNTGGNRTALAVASLQANTLLISRHDETGQEVEMKKESFDSMTQKALFVDDLFPDSQGSRGFLLIDATEPFFGLSLDQHVLLLSSGGLFPGVIERDITINFGVADFDGTLRLIQNGPLLTGTIRLRSSTDTEDGPIQPVSGVLFEIAETTQYFLQLTWGVGDTQLLLSDQMDKNLTTDNVGAAASVISTGPSIGAPTIIRALFQLSKKDNAQF